MINKKKVEDGLKCCSIQIDVGCQACPYYEERKEYGKDYCTTVLSSDALLLMRERDKYIAELQHAPSYVTNKGV